MGASEWGKPPPQRSKGKRGRKVIIIIIIIIIIINTELESSLPCSQEPANFEALYRGN
jgi:hypothetical protein